MMFFPAIWLLIIPLLMPLLAQAADTTGASHAYKAEKSSREQQQAGFTFSNCGQRCAYLSSAEVLSYYSIYALNNTEAITNPAEQEKTKRAIDACLTGSGKNCSAADREILVARVTQYNFYRDIRRKILEAQSNAKALESGELPSSSMKTVVDPRIASKRDLLLLSRVMNNKSFTPPELTPDGMKPFKIDPTALKMEEDDKVLFGGGFRRDYDYILNNYTRPRAGTADDLTNAYTNSAAAGYGHYKSTPEQEQVHELAQSAGGSLVTVDEARYNKDRIDQNSTAMNKARQEFLEKHKDRDLTARRTNTGAEVLNYEQTGIDKLGLNPKVAGDSRTLAPYQEQVKAINKQIDEQLEKKTKKEKQKSTSYALDINEFDQFLDTIWPTGATKKN